MHNIQDLCTLSDNFWSYIGRWAQSQNPAGVMDWVGWWTGSWLGW